MEFVWRDYEPGTMGYIESWLDDSAVKSTGLEEGFCEFYEYWANEGGLIPGEDFWCKVVLCDGKPFAAAALCRNEDKISVMELIVDPERRGCGMGSAMLRELLESEGILERPIHRCEAVIYPDNIASQKAFQNAGFKYSHTHEDGDGVSMLYVYERDRE